jgi:LysR family transcriptional regulator, transcriptional activator of nhaA
MDDAATALQWLNYHHLRYFFVTAREGSIAAASRVLHTSQPAISTQLRQLERTLGERLFRRQGRGLALTDLGRLAFEHAEQIFRLGQELLDAVRDRPTGRPLRMQVGLVDAVPKDLASRLLQPLLVDPDRVQLVVHEDRPDRLLADLALFQLDLVIADGDLAAGSKVKAFHHPLGESAIGVFAAPARGRSLQRDFPASLHGQPFVLPLETSEVRRQFSAWLRTAGLRVDVVAEVEDDALARPLVAAGLGLMLAPVVLAADLQRTRGLRLLGELPDVRARYVAITVERRVRHPAVMRLLTAARAQLFGADGK